MRKDNLNKQSGTGDILLPSSSYHRLSTSGLTRESRSKKKHITEGISIALCLAVSLNANGASAECVVPPSCESLGYNMTAAQCGKYTTLKCPFDATKVYCSIENCPSEYHLYSCPTYASCSWCGNKAKIVDCSKGYLYKNGNCAKCTTCPGENVGYMISLREPLITNNCYQKPPYIFGMVTHAICKTADSDTPFLVQFSTKPVELTYTTSSECKSADLNGEAYKTILKEITANYTLCTN